jgi:putative oxidoreductase
MSTFISSTVKGLHLNLDRAGTWIAPLTLRFFWLRSFQSGLEKFNGENWFADIQDRFLFPFNHLPATLNWELSMWVELICALALLVGLATRFSAISLMVVTIVATAAVHWPADWSTLSDWPRVTRSPTKAMQLQTAADLPRCAGTTGAVRPRQVQSRCAAGPMLLAP